MGDSSPRPVAGAGECPRAPPRPLHPHPGRGHRIVMLCRLPQASLLQGPSCLCFPKARPALQVTLRRSPRHPACSVLRDQARDSAVLRGGGGVAPLPSAALCPGAPHARRLRWGWRLASPAAGQLRADAQAPGRRLAGTARPTRSSGRRPVGTWRCRGTGVEQGTRPRIPQRESLGDAVAMTAARPHLSPRLLGNGPSGRLAGAPRGRPFLQPGPGRPTCDRAGPAGRPGTLLEGRTEGPRSDLCSGRGKELAGRPHRRARDSAGHAVLGAPGTWQRVTGHRGPGLEAGPGQTLGARARPLHQTGRASPAPGRFRSRGAAKPLGGPGEATSGRRREDVSPPTPRACK